MQMAKKLNICMRPALMDDTSILEQNQTANLVNQIATRLAENIVFPSKVLCAACPDAVAEIQKKNAILIFFSGFIFLSFFLVLSHFHFSSALFPASCTRAAVS